jgi:hypothetical protein
MKKFFLFIRNHYQQIFKGFLFALAVALLVWIFPQQGKFKYEFSKGKPWLHEDLYSPFDFSIFKLEEDLEMEQEEAVEGLPYYFRYQEIDTLATKQLLKLEFESDWQMMPHDSVDDIEYKTHNYRLLMKLYMDLMDEGILNTDALVEGLPPEYPVVVIRNNVAQAYDLEDLLTLPEAYTMINQQLEQDSANESEMLASLVMKAKQYWKEKLYWDLFHLHMVWFSRGSGSFPRANS